MLLNKCLLLTLLLTLFMIVLGICQSFISIVSSHRKWHQDFKMVRILQVEDNIYWGQIFVVFTPFKNCIIFPSPYGIQVCVFFHVGFCSPLNPWMCWMLLSSVLLTIGQYSPLCTTFFLTFQMHAWQSLVPISTFMNTMCGVVLSIVCHHSLVYCLHV